LLLIRSLKSSLKQMDMDRHKEEKLKLLNQKRKRNPLNQKGKRNPLNQKM